MLKHGILGLINYHEMTGYEIMQAFRDSLNYFWTAQTSQIYRELQTLEKEKWVEKTFVPQQGKPDKNIYSITEEGKCELLRWLSDGDLAITPRIPVLMKVFFMGERSREDSIRYFKGLEAYCKMFLESLEAVPAQIGAYSEFLHAGEKALYWGMTVEYGRRNMQMCMEWAQHCIEQLERVGINDNEYGTGKRIKCESNKADCDCGNDTRIIRYIFLSAASFVSSYGALTFLPGSKIIRTFSERGILRLFRLGDMEYA